MSKKNSLKVAPYADVQVWSTEGPRPVRRLLEYTMGKPGEQEKVGWGANGSEIVWEPNEPFRATLRIDRLERGRSAARFWFVGVESGIEYPFFGQGLVEMLSKSMVRNGLVDGKWIVVKRGSNYGIEMY